MRTWIFATVAISFLLFVNASQAVEVGDSVRLLSYSQLMQLTPEKRDNYLSGLRQLLVDLAASAEKNKNGFALEEIRELNKYFAFLQQVIPDANANPYVYPLVADVEPMKGNTVNGRVNWSCMARDPLPASLADSKYNFATGRLDQNSSITAFHSADGQRVKPGERDTLADFAPGVARAEDHNDRIYLERQRYLHSQSSKITFNYDVGTCVSTKPVPMNSHHQPDCEADKEMAGLGWHLATIRNSSGALQNFCVPFHSWDILPNVRKNDLTISKNPKGGHDVAVMYNEKSPAHKYMYMLTGVKPKVQTTLKPSDVGANGERLDLYCKPHDEPDEVARIAKLTPGQKAKDQCYQEYLKTQKPVAKADGKMPPHDPYYSPRVAPPPVAKDQKPKQIPASEVRTEQLSAPAKDSKEESSCIFRVTDCSKVDSAQAKKDFFASSESENMDCIFAGNISHYIDNDKRPGRCQAVYSFSYTDGKADLNCGSYKEIVCNPMVFGVKKDGSPFCVPAKGHATNECNEASTPDARMKDYLNQDISGIRDSWNKFADGFNRVCRTKAQRMYFCDECNVMMSRIHEMNRLALDVKDCGTAMPFTETPQDKSESTRAKRGQ